MAQTALITGASSGIGYELAKLFANDGYDLVLVARDEQRLDQAVIELKRHYGVTVIKETVDLSDSSAPERLYARLKQRNQTIDVLVNNAGIGYGGAFFDNTLQAETEVLTVNVVSLMRLTRLFGGDFIARKSGKILNVASLASFQPGPYLANYYATKAYVLSFSEALSRELRRHGVTVTVLCPGTTRTGFHRRARLEHTDLAKGLFGIVMDPKTVAAIGYKGLLHGKVIVVPGLVNKLAAASVRLAPRTLVTWYTGMINRADSNLELI